MRELITIATSFLVVVALAFYMYVSTQKHSIAVTENQKLRLMDSIYHKQ
jgi:hypothetical protein